MDVSKYVMFSVVFVYVDEVVLGYCSKPPLNTSILDDFCLGILLYHTVGRKCLLFVPTVWYMVFLLPGGMRMRCAPSGCVEDKLRKTSCDVPPVDAWKISCDVPPVDAWKTSCVDTAVMNKNWLHG